MRQCYKISLLLAIYGCSGDMSSTPSRPTWDSGGLHKRGHEDITRFGVADANNWIENELGIKGYYPLVTAGASGITTSNDMVSGNFESDFPGKVMLDYYGVATRLSISAWNLWHNDPALQNIHSLRNYEDNEPQTIRDACLGITNLIVNASLEALRYYATRDKPLARYFIGHATHIIQDSFSEDHSIRRTDNFKEIIDICTYGRTFANICFHSDKGSNDRVWKDSPPRCKYDATYRVFDCLKTNAQAAAYATTGYLIVMARLVEMPMLDPRSQLNQYFTGVRHIPASGYFRCQDL